MLGSIQGFVGTFQESFRTGPVDGRKGNSDTAAGADLDIVDQKRHIEAGNNSVCERYGRVRCRCICRDLSKVVSAQSRD